MSLSGRLVRFLRVASTRTLFGVGGAVAAVGGPLAAGVSALTGGPVPPPKPVAQVLYQAAHAPNPQGFSAVVTLQNHLFEGASLSGSGELSASPLINGGEGRLWVSFADHKARLELDSQRGSSELVIEPGVARFYDVASNTLYLISLPTRSYRGHSENKGDGTGPTLAAVERALRQFEENATVSVTPSDLAGRPVYDLEANPREKGSLFAGAEVALDAQWGLPLRFALRATGSTVPAVSLELSQPSFEAIPSSIFTLSPGPGTKVVHLSLSEAERHHRAGKPHAELRTVGHGVGTVLVATFPAKVGEKLPLEGKRTTFAGAPAQELATELGTMITYLHDGTRTVAAAALRPATLLRALGG